jgi:tetratricopeptide (TPR) repeat protein
MRFKSAVPIVAAVFLLCTTLQVRAQDPPQESSSKPAGETPAPPPKSPPKKNKDSATQNAPDQPMWDPLRAEKDLEVGQFYMKKGDLDAAIDRFQDAAIAKPGYAVPFRFLGEAQEKKGLKKQALKSYQRYLDLFPHADDGDKVRKKIDKLYKEIEKEKKK